MNKTSIKLPTHSFKRMVDLSTSHLTLNDTYLLGDGAFFPRSIKHEYGYIVFVAGGQSQRKRLIAVGFSEAFCAIYDAVCVEESDIILINFDCDGEVIRGLPTFDW